MRRDGDEQKRKSKMMMRIKNEVETVKKAESMQRSFNCNVDQDEDRPKQTWKVKHGSTKKEKDTYR